MTGSRVIFSAKPHGSSLVDLTTPRTKWLSTKQAAAYLGISVSTLHKLSSRHVIAYYKPNGKLKLFLIEDLDKYASKRRIPTNDELME